jgi:hypothetical protein
VGARDSIMWSFHQHRQLSDIGRYATRFVACKQIGGGAPSGVLFKIDVSQNLPIVVPHDEARAIVIDRPRCGEAADWHRP